MAPRSQILSTKTFLKSVVLLQQMLLDPIPLKLPKHSLCHQFVCRKSIFCLLGSFYLYGEVRPHSLAKQQETYLYQFTVIYMYPSKSLVLPLAYSSPFLGFALSLRRRHKDECFMEQIYSTY